MKEIVHFGHPSLKIASTDVLEFDKDLKNLTDEMIQIMYDAPGVGLAAPQIGINKNIFVFDAGDGPKVAINPHNLILEGSITFMEGCLSIPSTLTKPVRTIRASKVIVQTDNLGELTFEINPEGDKANESISKETMMTVIVQHEIDHLDGFTIKDRVYNTQVVKKVDFGRNEKIVMKSKEGEMVEVKFKNANKLFLQGYEIV